MQLLSLHVAQSCYSATYDKPFLWSKAKFNLCNFVLPEPIITKLLVGLIKLATATQMSILAKFGWVGNSPQIAEI